MQGIILFEEFRKAISELGLHYVHSEEDIRSFFNAVENRRVGEAIKISLDSLVNFI